jgi:phosphate uptake regulator/aminoglycoside phosphotransferase (APT) family kinase protein
VDSPPNYSAVADNLRFLAIEVKKQLGKAQSYLKNPSRKMTASVQSGDDYVDNLKSIIQRKCFALAAQTARENKTVIDSLKCFETVAVNLERISDFCERVIGQHGYIENPALLDEFELDECFARIDAGLSLVEGAVLERDTRLALRVCRIEQELDELYGSMFGRIVKRLSGGEDAETLITILFMVHYLERMGDALLNVGEAVLSASLGERIKIGQLRTLEGSLEDLRQPLFETSLRAIAETRSGATIATLERDPGAAGEAVEQGPAVIFKEGRTSKLEQELASVERWEKLYPGIVPKVFSFQRHGENSAILYEYLRGRTFEDILLRGTGRELATALASVLDQVDKVWMATRRPQPISANFMGQLGSRIDDVFAAHPGLMDARVRMGDVVIPSYLELLERAQAIEASLQAPFSVYAHGDFNLDNVIYDAEAKRVRLIDLHRSHMTDYVQDVTVFLVSNYRLQMFESRVRQRIEQVMLRFYEFARNLARREGDVTFEIRAALGLARSFGTSTRFVLDERLARSMFLRSRFLLERIAALPPDRLTSFEMPQEVLRD